MTHRFKTLGLALVAVLAMSTVVASAAQAQFTASSYPKSGTAESPLGNDTFSTEAGVVQCRGHFAFGPLTGPSSTVTVTPTYSNCTAFGFAATVNMNGCDYILHDTANNTQGKVTIDCAIYKAGNFYIETPATITAGPCEMEIWGQSNNGNVFWSNNSYGISVQANVTGISYKATKDGFLCPFNGTGHKLGGTYVQHLSPTVMPVGGGSLAVH